MVIATSLFAQNYYLKEQFDSSVFPPNGWSFDGNANNWSYSATNISEGEGLGEALLDGEPSFYGTSRFISPSIDLSNASNVSLRFNHNLYYSTSLPGDGVIGCATRSGGGSWHSIWEVSLTGDIETEQKTISINNGDTGASDFQFCFYFTGASYIVGAWYLDDIRLYSSYNHDAGVSIILGKSSFDTGAAYDAKAIVKNSGLSSETFNVKYTLFDHDNTQVFTDTKTVSALNANATDTVEFSSFVLNNENDLYKVVVTTQLSQDENAPNDTAFKNIYTYTHERSFVLMEVGTGTWCYLCPSAAQGIDELIENNYNVAAIEYHSDDDYATTEGGNRLNFYVVSGFPTTIFDGIDYKEGGIQGSLYSDYVPYVDSRNSVKTGIEISMTGTQSNDTYQVNVNIDKVGPVADTNIVAYLALTESGIPENWQGMHELDYVERLLLPNADGEQIDLVNNDHLSLDFNVEIDNSWVFESLEVVAFVQNLETREVLNCTKGSLSVITGVRNVKPQISFKVYPNPVHGLLNVKSAVSGEFMLFDINGKALIKQSVFENELLNVDVVKLPAGMYFAKVVGQNNTETLKVSISN